MQWFYTSKMFLQIIVHPSEKLFRNLYFLGVYHCSHGLCISRMIALLEKELFLIVKYINAMEFQEINQSNAVGLFEIC